MDCSPPGSSVHGASPGKNTGVGCHFLLQGIFPTQESNPRLLCFLYWQAGSLPLVPPGKPHPISMKNINVHTTFFLQNAVQPVSMPSVSERLVFITPSFPSFLSIKNKVFQKDLSRFYPIRAFVVFESEYCFSSIQKETSKSKTTSVVPAGIKHMTPFPTFSSSKVIPSERNETIFKQLCGFFNLL